MKQISKIKCPKCGSTACINSGYTTCGKQRYECKYCGKRFQSEYMVQDHNVECIICGAKAYKNTLLDDGRQSFKCSVCKKYFIFGGVKKIAKLDRKTEKQIQIYSRVSGLRGCNIAKMLGVSEATVSRVKKELKEAL